MIIYFYSCLWYAIFWYCWNKMFLSYKSNISCCFPLWFPACFALEKKVALTVFRSAVWLVKLGTDYSVDISVQLVEFSITEPSQELPNWSLHIWHRNQKYLEYHTIWSNGMTSKQNAWERFQNRFLSCVLPAPSFIFLCEGIFRVHRVMFKGIYQRIHINVFVWDHWGHWVSVCVNVFVCMCACARVCWTMPG